MRRACEFKRQEAETAGKVYAAGEHDLKVFRQQLEQVYSEIAASRCLPPPPSFKKLAGGKVVVADRTVFISLQVRYLNPLT